MERALLNVPYIHTGCILLSRHIGFSFAYCVCTYIRAKTVRVSRELKTSLVGKQTACSYTHTGNGKQYL